MEDIVTKSDSFTFRLESLLSDFCFSKNFDNPSPNKTDEMFGSLSSYLKIKLIQYCDEMTGKFSHVNFIKCYIDCDWWITVSFTRNETTEEFTRRKDIERKQAEAAANRQKNRQERENDKFKKRYEHFLKEKEYFDSIETKDII